MDDSDTLVRLTNYTSIVGDRYADVDGDPAVIIEKNGSYGLMSSTGEEIVRPALEFLNVLDNYYGQDDVSADIAVPTYDMEGSSYEDFDSDDVDWYEYDTDEFLFLRNVDGDEQGALYDWTTETLIQTIPTFDEGNDWDAGSDTVYYVGSYGDYALLRYETYYRHYGTIQDSETHNEYIIYDTDEGSVAYTSGQDAFVWADEENDQLVVMEAKAVSDTTSAPVVPSTTSAPSTETAAPVVTSDPSAGSTDISVTAVPSGDTTQAPSGNGQETSPTPAVSASGVPGVLVSLSPSPVVSLKPTSTPKVTSAPAVTSTPKTTKKPTSSTTTKKKTSSAKVGKIFSRKASNGRYKITKATGNRTVTYLSPLKKSKRTYKIPAKVTYKGKTYKVTKVAKKAFYGNKNLVYLELGKNIKQIGARAFANCTSLRYIMVKTNKIAESAVGYHAFYGDSSSIRVKTSPERWRRYARAFMREGLPNGVIFVIEPVPLVRSYSGYSYGNS
jgi:hypothetical protein